jgi:hypothetical protein
MDLSEQCHIKGKVWDVRMDLSEQCHIKGKVWDVRMDISMSHQRKSLRCVNGPLNVTSKEKLEMWEWTSQRAMSHQRKSLRCENGPLRAKCHIKGKKSEMWEWKCHIKGKVWDVRCNEKFILSKIYITSYYHFCILFGNLDWLKTGHMTFYKKWYSMDVTNYSNTHAIYKFISRNIHAIHDLTMCLPKFQQISKNSLNFKIFKNFKKRCSRGMITRQIWKFPCIKLFITYFRHLEKRHPYWPETKSRPIL